MAKESTKETRNAEQGTMSYEVTKRKESGTVIEVTVTSGKYAGKKATIAQISSLSAYYNVEKT